jgi:hypothetical protein
MVMNVQSLPAMASPGTIHQTAMQGARQAVQEVDRGAAKLSSGNVDVRTVVETDQQVTLYTLNMKMISMADEMVGQVLDILA